MTMRVFYFVTFKIRNMKLIISNEDEKETLPIKDSNYEKGIIAKQINGHDIGIVSLTSITACRICVKFVDGSESVPFHTLPELMKHHSNYNFFQL